MPAWLATIARWLAPLLVKELVAAFRQWLKEREETRKTVEEVKQKIKELKNAKTQEEIRKAIRDINI